MAKRALLTLMAILPCLVAGRAHAATDDLRAAALVRVLAYDDALKSKAGGRVVIGVLHREPDTDGAMRAKLKGMAAVTVQGLPIVVVDLTYTDAAALRQSIAQDHVSALYVARGLEAPLAAIVAVTRDLKVTTMCTDEAFARQGVSLAAIDVDGSPKARLIVNLTASRLEGMSLRPELLRVVQIINE